MRSWQGSRESRGRCRWTSSSAGVDLGLEVGLSKRDIRKLRWVFTHRN